MTIEGPAIRALLDAVGLDLARIRSEADKLVLYAAGERTITAAHVRDVVASTEEPTSVFALIDFIRSGNTAAALREIGALVEDGSPGPMILGLIRVGVQQLRPEARAREALRRVLETDLAIKSSQGEPRFVLERLVAEICGGGSPAPPVRRSWA
jgi:DNA polymerase III delta subunit